VVHLPCERIDLSSKCTTGACPQWCISRVVRVFVKVIGSIVSLPLMLFLPGYALFRGRLFKGVDVSWAQRLLVVIGTSAAITSLLALLMAEAGFLRIWLLDLVLAAVAVVALLVFGSTPRRIFFPRPGRWEVVIVLVLIVLSVFIFFKPAEFVGGEGDPSYYFNIGFNLAHTGAINITEASVPKMSDYELFTFYVNNIAQFDAFQLRERATGRIQPLLYHLLPVWIGLFIMLMGTFGGLYVIPLFALLGLLALYALARRVAGVVGAAAACLLGATFTLTVWFARIPLSEMMGAFFVLCSILFFIDCLRRDNILMGLGAALCATAAACARPEAALLFVPLLAVMVVRMFQKRYAAADYVTADALLVGAGLVLVYIKVAEFNYVSANFGKVVKLLGSHANMNTLLGACALVLLAGLVVFNLVPLQRLLARSGRRLRTGLGARAPVIVRVCQGALAVVVLLAFLFLFNFGRGAASARAPQKMFISTALLFGGVAVFVFVAGLCLLLLRAEQLSFSFIAAFMVVALSVGVQESSLALGLYPWDSRRYMTLTVPLLLVGFGFLASALWKYRGVVLKAVVVVVTVLFVVLFCWRDAVFFNMTDYKGLNAQLTQAAGKMDGDVVIFVNGYNAEVFGVPLRYQHGVDVRKVFVLRDARAVAQLVKSYTDQGRRVLIDTTDMHAANIRVTRDINSRLKFVPAFDVTVSYPHMIPVTGAAFPKKTVEQTHQLHFYYVYP
jgi:hypothetical protein